jgi:hypothetical protein
MNDNWKIQIAREFIGSHKSSEVDDWQPLNVFGDNKYLDIYENLIQGEYGFVNEEVSYCDFEIEIDGRERADGNPYLFSWDVAVPGKQESKNENRYNKTPRT